MIEYAIKEDAVETKPLIRRAAMAAMLAMAALGAHHLHGRALSNAATENRPTPVAAVDENIKALNGPNSLFGDDVSVDQNLAATSSADLETNEIELASVNDLAGAPAIADTFLDRQDSSSTNQIAVADVSATAQSVVTAVPEPTTAGLLLLAAAPIVSSRRSRSRVFSESIAK